MLKVKRIDHVAVCVKDLDEAARCWRALGLLVDTRSREVVESQNTEVALLPVGEGGTQIELVAPQGNEGLARFLDKRGPGLHHLAVEVEGIEQAIAALVAIGVPMVDTTPRRGARGHKVAFVHPKATGGVLVELVEPEGAQAQATEKTL